MLLKTLLKTRLDSLSLRTVLILAALVMGVSLSWRPLAVPDEGRYLGGAIAMWHSGDWLIPRLNGLPFFHKPPLFYWLAALGHGLGGGAVWAGRAASWLGGVAGLVALAWLLKAPRQRAADEADADTQARWAVLVLALQPLWYLGAQYANMDMLVGGLIAAAIAALARSALTPAQTGPRWWAVLAIGLGVLAKGLIGIVLPVAVIVVWLVLERQWARLWALAWWPGWLAIIAVVGPWFWLVEQHSPGFLHYFVVVQHFKRYASTGFNNVMPFWFYAAVLALFMLPWSGWLVGRLWQAVRHQGWRAWVAAKSNTTSSEGLSPLSLDRLAWVWLAVITLFFSLPASKLVGYILPAVPAAALLISTTLTRQRVTPAWWQGPGRATGLVALSVVLCLGLTLGVARSDRRGSAPVVQALRSHWQPGDALAFWGRYFYDVPVLLDYRSPVPVIGENLKIGTHTGDGWEQELLDAAEFELDLGQRLLLSPAQWPQLRCAGTRRWVLAPSGLRDTLHQLTQWQPVQTVNEVDLYLVPAASGAGKCPETAEHKGQ